jgi:hypothetical protein
MDAAQLAREVKRAGLDVPVVVLAYDYREIKNFVARNPVTDIERIFLWQGNARILIAIVKYIEDKRNVRTTRGPWACRCCWWWKTTSAITRRSCP